MKETALLYLNSAAKNLLNNYNINDNLQQLVENIYDHYFIQQSTDENFAENYHKIYCKDLLEVKTGKQDANFGCNNGKYKFFTCSRETLRCDVPAFSGHSILIAGNGDFNVKHYSGEFNAYQRTYVLIPNDEIFYGTLYMASLKLVNKFKKASAGSIVKFISKSDVENIEIIVPKDRTLLLQLNEYLYAIEKHQKEIEKLESLREFLLPMLMNGQISIA